ncbi:MAG: SRPBCC family protein [Chloroflexi bacterium]|nr:SRPBCC family protein [Chloroflexota bacterium]
MHRSVAFEVRDGQPASAVALSRTFPAAIADVWDAVTNGDRIPRWFAPVSGNLELHGRYQVEGNAGGTIAACEAQSHLGLTWEFAGDVSWVEVQVSEDGNGGTRLALCHTALLSEHWETFGPGAVGVGWEMAFLGLALHLERPDDPKIDEAEFATSPEGRAFIHGSSEGWAKAAIAAGTEVEVANAAAGRTAAFYTGEGEG